MQLLGGLLGRSGALVKNFAFKDFNGDIEMAVFDSLQSCQTQSRTNPQWVTEFLCLVLNELADYTRNDSQFSTAVNQLCVSDRLYILICWRQQFLSPTTWYTSHCDSCENQFDYMIDWGQLPVKPAGKTFPYINFTDSNNNPLRFRTITGEDQIWLAQQHRHIHLSELSEETKLSTFRLLLKRLAVDDIAVSDLSNEELIEIESQLEAMSPELANTMQLECTECGAIKVVSLDIYQDLVSPIDDLLDDVHLLASQYHWNESSILSLSTSRRAQYIARLERHANRHGGLV